MSEAPHPDWDRDGRDWPNRETSRFLRTAGIAWHLQHAGTGPRLLLLHGTGGATHSWRDLIPLLARDFEALAPDLPGHGFTRAPAQDAMSLPGMARAIRDLLAAEDFAPDVIVGHSAGAAVAIRMALDDLCAPSVIVGLNPALTPFRGVAGALFPPMAKALALNPFTPWMFSSMAGWQAQARRLIDGTGSRLDARGYDLYARVLSRPDHVSGALLMMAKWELEPLLADLPSLTVPFHLVTGSSDRAVPPSEAARLAATHDTITRHVLDGLGHLMHEEEPDRVATLVREIAFHP